MSTFHSRQRHLAEKVVSSVSVENAALPVTVNFPGNGNVDPSKLRKIALLGTFPPRQCGIATYTADVLASIRSACPQADVFAIAVSKGGAEYDYPGEVAYEVRDSDPQTYHEAAEYLNGLQPDVLIVQHEYGIFGGEAGSHLFELLDHIEIPVVTVMHTVLADPPEDYRAVTHRLLQASDQIIVMTRMAAGLLRRTYGSAGLPMIGIIPHGIPDVPFESSETVREELDLSGKFTLLTFGLLSPGKGIEYAIDAMPGVAAANPEALYVILGATHPCLVETEGERYRESLMERARALGVEGHVRFVNQYVDIGLLTKYLQAADVYVTPYLNEAQITSGTLAYASGSGCPVISTPYWHASELITEDRGFVVPFRDSQAITEAVCRLISRPEMRSRMRRRAWEAGRESIWSVVGMKFATACASTAAALRRRAAADARRPLPGPESHALPGPVSRAAAFSTLLPSADGFTPEPDTAMLLFPFVPCRDHLRNMLTPLGIWQHAVHQTPDRRHGFCTDDNARMLILASRLMSPGADGEEDPREWLTPARHCFHTLEEAYNQRTGRFRNFRDAQGKWLEEEGSPDSHGRALWACGVAAATAALPEMRARARSLLVDGLASVMELPDLRPGVFAALGICAVLEGPAEGNHGLRIVLTSIVNRLKNAWRSHSREDWPWFEEHLTYDNAKLPHALLAAGHVLKDHEAVSMGLASLRWLMGVQTTRRGHFRPVGCKGWMKRGDTQPAQFDQQPLEAWASTDACLAAWRITGDAVWQDAARRAYLWFLGENDLGLSLYDPSNGGVCDGLQPHGVNRNQGAESVLSFHLAHAAMAAAQGRHHTVGGHSQASAMTGTDQSAMTAAHERAVAAAVPM